LQHVYDSVDFELADVGLGERDGCGHCGAR
jgi:hypothetical protein